MKHKELPMLAGIAAFIRWVEELANLVSGPLLTLGLGIALVDLLTDGSLLARVPALLYAWAITQAVGVDAQLVAMWDKAHIALRERRYWALVGLVVLGLVLAYVAWIAAQVFALQESEGLTAAAALARLGMDSAVWLVQRTALSVTLVCLAGWTRYHPPAPNVALEAEAERNRLEADLLLEPLRAQKRAMQVRGLRSVALSAMGKDIPAPSEATPAPLQTRTTPSDAPERPPTGPGTPAQKRGVRKSRKRGAKVVALRNPSVEEKAAAAWAPGMSIPALEKAAKISRPSAQKYHAKFTAQAQQNDQAVQ